MKNILLIQIPLLLLLCASCSIPETEYPPFFISDFTVKKGEIENVCAIAAVLFDFGNTGKKDIVEISISFRLYYSDQGYPDYGNNLVEAVYSDTIFPGKKATVTVPLDRFIRIYRDLPLIADQIFVRKIVYADGSVWTDPAGLWQAGGL
jgi:hypothetical protein